MSIFSGYADSPNQIDKEGAEVSLKFVNNNDGTGTLSWNIPAPAAGCSSDMPGAYNGIVITADNKNPNYTTTSPKNGIFYNGDPTVDRDVHVGDKLDTALVLGAFYNDRTTTSMVVTGIQPRTVYYFSGYPVDRVARYFRTGVHAQAVATGADEWYNTTADTPAHQDLLIDVLGGININRSTGLNSSLTYSFAFCLNGQDYTITINGVDALTYADLIDAINVQFKLLENPIMSPTFPNINGYYWDAANKKLYLWDGDENVQQSVIVSNLDPSSPILGTYWFNPTTEILKVYETGGWVTATYLESVIDPTHLACGQLWYDGTDVWEWDGNHWCKLCVYVQTRNPALAPIFDCETYWYDTANKQFFKYNEAIRTWDEVLVILSTLDPNTLNTGDFWYNETDTFVYEFVGGSWNKLGDIRYSERNEHGGLDFPAPDTYWFIPTELRLYLRNHANTAWLEQPVVLYPTDPRNRSSCDLWFNESITNPHLSVWDELNNQWVAAGAFFYTGNNPALPPNLPDCAVWLNPTDGSMKVIRNTTCDDRDYISFPFDPTNPSLYQYWYDTDDKIWYVWDGAAWVVITPISSTLDPFIVTVGEFWFDLVHNVLKQWNGSAWVLVPFSLTPLAPTVGYLWFNTTNDELYEWNGTTWVVSPPIVQVDFMKAPKPSSRSRDWLRFTTKLTGCNAYFEIKIESDNLFSKFTDHIIYTDPFEGSSGIPSGPMYKALGIGDDGSPDERRELHDYVRNALGGIVNVEINKAQINQVIDNALLTLRKNSGLAYQRNMFFMHTRNNQQTYILSNKCVGFNKIVGINAIYRMSAAFFRTAFAGNDLFGVAALQQLYTLGSFDMLTYHLISDYIEELETLFATRIMYQWDEPSRELKMYQNFFTRETLLLDVTIERTEQDLLTNRETAMWLRRWAVAEGKLYLSQVRGKFQQLPGPNGSTSLNTQDLINQAQTEMEALTNELTDMNMQNALDMGIRTHFLLG